MNPLTLENEMYMKLSIPTFSARQNPAWLTRMGRAGFAFFFIKGMLWLLIPMLAHSALFSG
jgi:hypothetical protein